MNFGPDNCAMSHFVKGLTVWALRWSDGRKSEYLRVYARIRLILRTYIIYVYGCLQYRTRMLSTILCKDTSLIMRTDSFDLIFSMRLVRISE